MKKIFITCLIQIAACLPMAAATYYCAPNGTANGNYYNTPCSLSEGLSKLVVPGDTLYLRGGQYDLLNTPIQNLQGTSTRRIVIAGYPGEKAILDFRSTPYGTRGLQIKSTCAYLHIKNLTLRYSGKNNLYNEGSYCLFEDLDIYGSADTGCQMKNGGSNIIKNVDSHDNFDYQNGGTSNADFGGNADGFADKQHSGSANHYIGCRSWNNSDDGWDFFQRVTTDETIIENCICYQNGPAEYDMRNHPRYAIDKTWFDNINGKTINNRYGQQQVVTLQHYPNHGNGNGFKMGGGYTDHKVLIHHCLSVANTVRGFDQNNNGGTMRVYNNTGYLNGINFGFTTAYGTLSIQNNISYLGVSGDSPKSQTVLVNANNSWNSMAASAADFLSLDTTQILQPRQSDGTLPSMTLLHLSPNSQYVDAGEILSFIYYGIAPDMGYHELETGNPINPNVEPEPYICKDGAHQVAYISAANAAADKAILAFLQAQDSLCITQTEAGDNTVDYTNYELLILSPVPNSAAAGFLPLKDSPKPRLIMKPFLFKQTVWNWGTAANTQETTITITAPSHPIFEGITSPITLYSKLGKQGVATISDWLVSPVTTLGTTAGADAIAEYSNTITIGLSEYSSAYITQAGLDLILNSIYYLLGVRKPLQTALAETSTATPCHKYIQNGKLFIQVNNHIYDTYGRCIQ